MADAIPTIPVTGDALPRISAPCVVFGAAVQAAEHLAQADEAAAGLPYGDPAYYRGPIDADRALEAAIDAATCAALAARLPVYRDVAEAMHFALGADTPHRVRHGLAQLRALADVAHADRTVRLSLARARGVMGTLAILWGVEETPAVERRREADREDASDLLADLEALGFV